MKKSELIKLVLVSGLLSSAKLNANTPASLTTNTGSNPDYLRKGFVLQQDTVQPKSATHGFVFIPRGGFGFFGHHAHVAG